MEEKDDNFSPKETKRRAEAALKRMLATPPKPHAGQAKKTSNTAKPKAKREKNI